jgi:hypothetical protein
MAIFGGAEEPNERASVRPNQRAMWSKFIIADLIESRDSLRGFIFRVLGRFQVRYAMFAGTAVMP